MAIDPKLFGSDLRVLHDPRRANSRTGGNDLNVSVRRRSGLQDLTTLTGVENLEQALLLRMLTPKGALAHLGHPQYGCRLEELVGEINTERTRNRAKMFALECLAQEPRVLKILSLEVRASRTDRSRIDIDATLKVIEQATPLNLVIPFSLTGGLPA